ncbi:MAG TPA: alanine racemase [Alphaproteobacteria bacterium]|nr:alanine racemase [Alphaproteobacteria bacterium]
MTNQATNFDELTRDCWVEINAAQLTENVRILKKQVNCPVLVAVKGNAYGHGYDIASRAFVKGGASYLGVANYSEGVAVRNSGVTVPILIMSGSLSAEMKLAAAAGMDFFIFRPDHVEAVKQMATGMRPVRIHIKVDTGMGRLGCSPQEALEIAKTLKNIPNVTIAGLATHFALTAPGNDFLPKQVALFDEAVKAFAAAGIRPEIIHAGKSATIHDRHLNYDMIRLGIIAYGITPSIAGGFEIPAGVGPALTWKARITSSKIFPAGAKISYGCEYEMPKQGRVGVLPVGYADGYQRVPKEVNTVLIDGRECRAIGRINMDQCMIDLGDMPDMTGAEVVLLGKQKNAELSVMELSKRWETNTYGVYNGIMARVPRREV